MKTSDRASKVEATVDSYRQKGHHEGTPGSKRALRITLELPAPIA